MNELIDGLAFDFKNVFILEKGLQNNEKSIVLIENGGYRGYVLIPFYGIKNLQSFTSILQS